MLSTRHANAGVSSNKVRIIGDGNCFFRAVLTAIRMKNITAHAFPEDQHMLLREMVVQSALANKSYNFDALQIEGYADRYEWAEDMNKERTWADNMAIEACSGLLEIPIEIYSFGQVVARFGDRHYSQDYSTKIDNRIRLELTNGHYDVIV